VEENLLKVRFYFLPVIQFFTIFLKTSRVTKTKQQLRFVKTSQLDTVMSTYCNSHSGSEQNGKMSH